MQNLTIMTINLILLFLILTSYEVASRSQKTLVAPLIKDTKTSLFTIILNSKQNYVIDLSSSFSWQSCSPSRHYPTVSCFTTECIQAQYLPSSCSSSSSDSTSPCICVVSPMNPVTQSCSSAQLTSKNVTISWINGGRTNTNVYLSCAPASLFRSLPRGVVGLASLSRAPLALPSQFSQSVFGVSQKFGLCLPSTSSANGVAFFGDGPYNLAPQTNFDAANFLSYTPLLINPKSADFFIGIKALSVGGKSIAMSPFEGIKISTIVPFTTLRTDIYKLFVKMFTEGMKGIPRVKTVKPFSTCYNASAIGFSRVGLHVPQIDLEFSNGKNWTVYGANSMKQVGGDSACLAFVNGGKTPEHSIVMGSFQMEDNFLVFDLDQSRLGFSSSLLFERMTCGNFDFTIKS